MVGRAPTLIDATTRLLVGSMTTSAGGGAAAAAREPSVTRKYPSAANAIATATTSTAAETSLAPLRPRPPLEGTSPRGARVLRRRVEGWILLEDRPLEPLQVGPRLEPELVRRAA